LLGAPQKSAPRLGVSYSAWHGSAWSCTSVSPTPNFI